jgi:hypothetical protein
VARQDEFFFDWVAKSPRPTSLFLAAARKSSRRRLARLTIFCEANTRNVRNLRFLSTLETRRVSNVPIISVTKVAGIAGSFDTFGVVSL